MVLRFIFIAFLLFLAACGLSFENPTDPYNVSHPSNIKYESFTDARDGKSYKSVVINGQTWMAENMNYNAPGSLCVDYVKVDPDTHYSEIGDTLVTKGGYCDIYGRLYDYETAKNICPSGWYLPSKTEWDKLMNFASWEKLRSKQGWGTAERKMSSSKLEPGKDTYGFTAIPTFLYQWYDVMVNGRKSYYYWTSSGYWWTATDSSDYAAYIATTEYSHTITKSTRYHYSVRCLQY